MLCLHLKPNWLELVRIQSDMRFNKIISITFLTKLVRAMMVVNFKCDLSSFVFYERHKYHTYN